MGSSLSRIQAIIYDRDFPRFPRPDLVLPFSHKFDLSIFCFVIRYKSQSLGLSYWIVPLWLSPEIPVGHVQHCYTLLSKSPKWSPFLFSADSETTEKMWRHTQIAYNTLTYKLAFEKGKN